MPPKYCLPTCAVFLLPSLRSPVSSMSRTPEPVGAVLGSSSRSFSLHSLTASGFHQASERNHCKLCAPSNGSVLARAVRVIALSRQKEPLEVAAEALALYASTEEIVEASSVLFERLRGGFRGQSFGRVWTPTKPLEHSLNPSSTNCW